MTEFHTQYQHLFGSKALIRTIMKRGMYHISPPMPKPVCEN